MYTFATFVSVKNVNISILHQLAFFDKLQCMICVGVGVVYSFSLGESWLVYIITYTYILLFGF